MINLKWPLFFFSLNRASFSGTTFSGGMSPDHPRFTENSINAISEFKGIDLNVKYMDFKKSIPKHENDFLYLDPPYLIDQKLYGNKGDMHENFDHEALAKLIKKRPGWVLSYNDSEQVRDLYKGHKFLKPEWTYGMSSNKKSNELIVLSKDYIRVA